MKLKFRTAAILGLLLTAKPDVSQAATTVVTAGPQAASSDFEVIFSTTLTGVEQLVTISQGSVYTGEGAAFTISAILPGNQLVTLFQSGTVSAFLDITLAALTNNTFTAFGTPTDLLGLRFVSYKVGAFGAPGTVSFPGGTNLTFNVVPELSTSVGLALGAAGFAFARRRRVAWSRCG
ncbi:PEP-CTERM sorting domain-containing protein [Luteolibacter arcticus]|uniref:PEP-CTERM sorting domain-containing protein n=1 Tax=Luteolibacter arcticus TaxID=1581411 RepID=A0ABT3GIG3_9BACT|nr:PEP-CTERM sorting domain-containing protein [Luteolibacter arcticus]MCW1923307.1 PEP-CTERM sorting domain-containing protein [Luteolibacter arcticus]